MKLWLVRTQGMQSSASGVPWGIVYVVAESPGAAWEAVRQLHANHDVGFHSDRILDSVKLIADAAEHPNATHRLLICERRTA